jgi:hypothetical protein
MKRFMNWILNKNELENIRRELVLLRLIVRSEIERQRPKRYRPVDKVSPLEDK